MGKPAARIGDMHTCPMFDGPKPHVGGPITMGCPTVLIGGQPAARVGDMVTCVGPPDAIALGSFGVLIGGMMAARMGDQTVHGGVITLGCPTVLIGEVGSGAGSGGGAGPVAGGAAGQSSSGSSSQSASPQSSTLQSASHDGSPFCEI